MSDVGYYSQGKKWACMGSLVIHGTLVGISQPLFSKVKEEKERMISIFRKMIRLTAFICFPILLGIAFIAKEFILIINPEFVNAVLILQISCMSGIVGCFILLYSQMCLTAGRSDYYFRITLLFAIIQIFGAVISISKGMYMLAFVVLIITIINSAVWHFYIAKIINIKSVYIIKDIIPYCRISIISFFTAWFVAGFFDNIYVIITLKIVISALIYVMIAYLAGSSIFLEMIKFILKK